VEPTSTWEALAEQVRAVLILELEKHLEGPRGQEAVDWILRLEGN
jgi:hypothetical protein